MRRQISLSVLLATLLILLLATLTPLFTPILLRLPPHSDLLFHLFAHALLSITLLHLVSPAVPAEAVCLLSFGLALLIELIQAAFIKRRAAHFADIVAGGIGSCAVFAVPRDGRLVKPSWTVLVAYLVGEDEDDEDDGHRVGSWAV